ncbi:hypothetical protein THAOC_17919, partial [Thalassiosira oceanica]
LREAIKEYLEDPDSAVSTYGPIETWDVSFVQDFLRLFVDDNNSALPGADTFNADISKWDVSRGTSFHSTFMKAGMFNQDISQWDVSKGEVFYGMFSSAFQFNQDISSWDVSRGTTFGEMFFYAQSFNQDISGWDVSSVGYFYCNDADEFNQDISCVDPDHPVEQDEQGAVGRPSSPSTIPGPAPARPRQRAQQSAALGQRRLRLVSTQTSSKREDGGRTTEIMTDDGQGQRFSSAKGPSTSAPLRQAT